MDKTQNDFLRFAFEEAVNDLNPKEKAVSLPMKKSKRRLKTVLQS